MTWYFDPSGGRFDAYDHNGDQVATDHEITDSWGHKPEAGQVHNPPQDFLDVMDSAMDGSQPSAYNQQTLRDAQFNNIQLGTPP